MNTRTDVLDVTRDSVRAPEAVKALTALMCISIAFTKAHGGIPSASLVQFTRDQDGDLIPTKVNRNDDDDVEFCAVQTSAYVDKGDMVGLSWHMAEALAQPNVEAVALLACAKGALAVGRGDNPGAAHASALEKAKELEAARASTHSEMLVGMLITPTNSLMSVYDLRGLKDPELLSDLPLSMTEGKPVKACDALIMVAGEEAMRGPIQPTTVQANYRTIQSAKARPLN